MSEVTQAIILTLVVLLYWPAVVFLIAMTGPLSSLERGPTPPSTSGE